MDRKRVRVRLRGIVQGVGFRPFVYGVAVRLGVGGFVLNSSAGVVAEVEGPVAAVDEFVRALTSEAPPLAWIQDVDVADMAGLGEVAFEIRESAAAAGEFALISPDVSTCDDCLADMSDPHNRRYRYPFTNCTNCGPRYTIVQDIPYDRRNTTMAKFLLCDECRREFEDPGDRRFHAQPNACPVCGPRLSAPVEEAIAALAAGRIVALKGLGGFHLACDARNEGAVARLRLRKRRSDKPFALMCRDLAAVERICELDSQERELMMSAQHPIVILASRGVIPEPVAPGNRTLGVMLPYTPLHHLLFAGSPYDTLVMTSGNLSEEPIVVSTDDARERLSGVADFFLVHDRDIFMRADDSVARVVEGRARVLRRSRGYAPRTIELGRDAGEILAVGGELKNAFCLTKGGHAILSQHIGDLENYETLVFFEETLANLKKLFRVEPRVVVHDLHPNYLSTKYALEMPKLRKLAVQHHHAHIASCMAENGLDGDVIGVALDGTGYGTDGRIWGGEFFTGGYRDFRRRAHFRYVPLAGGDTAVREPWRAALSYLVATFGYVPDGILDAIPAERVRAVRSMMETGFNTVETSSCGRLFDAVAAIVGLRREINFEGQAAIELEQVADPAETGRYDFAMRTGNAWELDFRPTIAAIVGERSVETASARFHNTVACAIAETCKRLREESGLGRVCLSGGTFQNVRLLRSTCTLLRAAGFEVYLHAKVPPNDGGIALGQAAIAASLFAATAEVVMDRRRDHER
jgi:hydrogenase maturation protein HypF